jgi:hypothetical protein
VNPKSSANATTAAQRPPPPFTVLRRTGTTFPPQFSCAARTRLRRRTVTQRECKLHRAVIVSGDNERFDRPAQLLPKMTPDDYPLQFFGGAQRSQNILCAGKELSTRN